MRGTRLTLTPEQEAEVCRLRDEKYRSWAWTWGKTPAFTYEKSGTFAGVPIRVAYQAKKGMISDAVIDCAALDGAEPHSEEQRRRIEEMLGVKAYNSFGMSEMCGPGDSTTMPASAKALA